MSTLAQAEIGKPVRIAKAELDDDVGAWLAAVGLAEGEEVVVLRRAALGGPLHVRLSAGGELAVAREIAQKLSVETSAEASEASHPTGVVGGLPK
jgi:ferrous iron transport protein A